MIWTVQVSGKKKDSYSNITQDAHALGIDKSVKVCSKRLYFIEAGLGTDDILRIAQQLLIDPVTESFVLHKGLFSEEPLIDKWTFSTNGVSIMGKYGIPCIGFGPGHEDQAHAPNEKTWKHELVKAAAMYAVIPSIYVGHFGCSGNGGDSKGKK